MHDAVAVVLLRCAQVGRSYWGWTAMGWLEVIGFDQTAFRRSAPGWADEVVRPYLSAHAYLIGGFNDFNQLGSFSRLTLAWRVFGRARVDAEIKRISVVLGDWGYRLGRDDDKLLPMVACQVLLLNRSPVTDEEHAAVDDGQTAVNKLLERLVDVPTPAGPTPTPDRHTGDGGLAA